MNIKFKKLHEDAVLPSYAKSGDGGLDLTAATDGKLSNPSIEGTIQSDYHYYEYKTGLAVEIPEGYVGLIFPRSSISKTPLVLANSVGVIDSGYRGEISFRFKTSGFVKEKFLYKKGDRIGQLIIVPYPKILPVWSEELSNTERGSDGFGSCGV